MIAPRMGSRKAIVFAAYQWEGLEGALKVGKALKLAEGSIRNWVSAWKVADVPVSRTLKTRLKSGKGISRVRRRKKTSKKAA